MSHLITIDPNTELLPQEQGCEYGYYLFDPLPPIHTDDIYHIDDIPEITITNPDNKTLTYFDPKNPGGNIERLLSLLDGEHYEVISSLQDQDAFCHHILQPVCKIKSSVCQTYKIENDMLKCHQSINGQFFYPIVLP